MKTFCLYRHYDKDGKLLYIGRSNSFFNRNSQHKTKSYWFKKICNINIEHFKNRNELIFIEEKSIKEEKPLYNIFLQKVVEEKRNHNTFIFFVKNKKLRSLGIEAPEQLMEITGRKKTLCRGILKDRIQISKKVAEKIKAKTGASLDFLLG